MAVKNGLKMAGCFAFFNAEQDLKKLINTATDVARTEVTRFEFDLQVKARPFGVQEHDGAHQAGGGGSRQHNFANLSTSG